MPLWSWINCWVSERMSLCRLVWQHTHTCTHNATQPQTGRHRDTHTDPLILTDTSPKASVSSSVISRGWQECGAQGGGGFFSPGAESQNPFWGSRRPPHQASFWGLEGEFRQPGLLRINNLMQTQGPESLRSCRSKPLRGRERCRQEHVETSRRKSETHGERGGDTQREWDRDTEGAGWREGDIHPFTSFPPSHPQHVFWARPWWVLGTQRARHSTTHKELLAVK